MKQFFLLMLSAVIMVTGCKTATFVQTTQNSQLLPALQPEMDYLSFETAYSLGTTNSSGASYSGLATSYGNVGVGTVAASSSIAHRDPRIQTARDEFEKEVRGRISQKTGERYGYAVCRIKNHSYDNKGVGLAILSGFTVGTLNLLGMPVGSKQGYASLSVEILDSKKNVIGIYEAESSAKYPIALYWGYSGTKAARMAYSNPFVDALNNIKTQIARDYTVLNEKLVKSGAIN
ncbi:hypothetical protein [Rubrolithibacter danxiaensis]|uniref:hypothetical protein n=1 Tax=Rubrolithibacter danxiaensis TaxID=3390805 RepID=UPI003BF779FD